MTNEIFRCVAGSRLYGTNTPDSDTDFKAVHLPTKEEILLGRGKPVISRSTGDKDERNGANDVDVESFTLQRYLKLASDMQTIPVEMLFVDPRGDTRYFNSSPVWNTVVTNRNKILSNNTDSFVGYCKGQAVRYSMRGKRLETFTAVHDLLSTHSNLGVLVSSIRSELESIDGVRFVDKLQPGGVFVPFMSVNGRQVPATLKCREAAKVYAKPISEAGKRATAAMEAGNMDCKALYHAMRIADQGIELFSTGNITFPSKNIPLLMKIRKGEVDLDETLDLFDEKVLALESIGANSPLSDKPDLVWIDSYVSEVYEGIVRGK